MAALATFEGQWGGTLAERMEARAKRWAAGQAAAHDNAAAQ
jgi:hypothetical protein